LADAYEGGKVHNRNNAIQTAGHQIPVGHVSLDELAAVWYGRLPRMNLRLQAVEYPNARALTDESPGKVRPNEAHSACKENQPRHSFSLVS